MPNFKVTAASRQQRMRPDGGTSEVYIAWLETDRGATGSVMVPASIWESEQLKGHLMTEAKKLDHAFDLINGED